MDTAKDGPNFFNNGTPENMTELLRIHSIKKCIDGYGVKISQLIIINSPVISSLGVFICQDLWFMNLINTLILTL